MGSGPVLYAAARASAGINSSRGDLGHGCEHAFVLATARFQLSLHHSLALRCKIGSGRGDALAAPRRSDRGEKQILRDDSHLPKDNAACAVAKGALRPLFETRLSGSRHGVHVTQAIGQNFHHMRRKMRCLLNEKVKPAAVDLRQPGGTLRDGIRRAGTVINQRHLTKKRPWTSGFEHKITKENVDFPFQ